MDLIFSAQAENMTYKIGYQVKETQNKGKY